MSNQPPTPQEPKVKIAGLMGLGFDHQDGHKRLTTGEKFVIAGGSEETHGRMTETVLKTFEHLKRKGKDISDLSTKELAEIVHKSTPR